MFRRKEEDTIEELSVMVSDNNSDQQNRTDVALSSANPVNRTQTVPASATPVVGSYRPASSTAQVASPMRPSSAAPRPAGGGAFSPADAAIRSASSNEDPRQSPVGSGKNNKRVLTDGNDLIVRNRLTIYSTGKVRGKISYGEIEIERGGQMTGEIRISGESDAAEKNKKNAA